jgi:hypothetical protein
MQPNLNITYYGPKLTVIIFFPKMISGWFVIGFLPVQCHECQFETRTTRRSFSKSTVMQFYQNIAYYGLK